MRAPLFLIASALALAAVAAAAQDAAPVANGLEGLANTVGNLSDEPAPQGQPEAAPPPAAEPQAQPETAPVTPPTPAAEPPPATPPPARPRLTGPALPLTGAERAQLAAATERGRLLGVIDRAGRFATQDMLSRIPDPAAAGITGWIAEQEGNGVGVTFYADTAAGPVSVYKVSLLAGRVSSRASNLTGERPPLNPIQARMAAARAAAGALDNRPCQGEDFNVFVVPPSAPDAAIDVYQISPQTQRGRFPLGGHFKVTVAADGSVAARRGFTNACLDAEVADPTPNARPAPIAVTHLLDPLPQEIHVFLAIWTGHPLIVVAGEPQKLFQVTAQGIAEVPPAGPGR